MRCRGYQCSNDNNNTCLAQVVITGLLINLRGIRVLVNDKIDIHIFLEVYRRRLLEIAFH